MNATKKQIDELNDLLTRNYDAEKGYANAAEEVNDEALKDFFLSYSKQRNKFGHEIKDQINKLGGEIHKGTSLAGDIHRGWMDLKGLLTGHDEDAIINECIRGENTALADYKKVMDDESLDSETREVIRSHHQKIQEAILKIKELHQILEK